MTTMAQRRSRGHTLVELVVALAVGALVAATAASLYRSQREAFDLAQDDARLAGAAASALALLGMHVRLAGYGLTRDADSAVFGCSGGKPAMVDARCERLADGSDGVRLRHRADAVATWTTSDDRPTDCMGQGIAPSEGNAMPQAVNRFYATRSKSSGEAALYCLGNGGSGGSGGSGSPQPSIDGVERLVFRYRLVSRPGASVDVAALGAAGWREVVAVDVCVVVRGERRGGASEFVDCSGARVRNADGYRRFAARATYAVRNAGAAGMGAFR